jgi:hypothetical protein
MSGNAKKRNPQFEELLRKTSTVDDAGNVKVKGMYASTFINFGFDGGIVSVPTSHVVWFLTRGRWPNEGLTLDHCDDDSMNNAPDNLQEMTMAQNHRKRRGRIVSRSYGSGKYGYGLYIYSDPRDGRHYVTRTLSRGMHSKECQTVKKTLGGFNSLKDAERRVRECIAGIEKYGIYWMPPEIGKSAPKFLNSVIEEMKAMREKGMSLQSIADHFDCSLTSVFNRVKDVGV